MISSGISYAQNCYVQQDNITTPNVTTSAQIYNLPISQRQTVRTYTDGLGRAIQTIAIQASVNNNDDIVQPIQYDNLGRQTTQYLPYVGADGSGNFHSSALTEQQTYYTAAYNDSAPYSASVFDNSPLQRLLEAGSVGQGYQPNGTGTQHYKTVSYRNNTSTDNVIVFSVTGTYTAGTYYAANLLSVTDGKDEDGVETLAFADYLGRAILKRQVTGNSTEPYLDTYYIYNSGGKIAYVVTPKGSATIYASPSTLLFSSAPLSNLIFYYVYDTQGRLIQKKTPSAPVTYIIYDPLNRPVLVQDGNMRAGQNWYYIKYDAKGRAISQGIYNDAVNITPGAMQTYVNGLATAYATTWYESRSGSSTNKYYTNSVFPTTGITPLAFGFYDDYDLYQTGSVAYNYLSQGLTNEETQTTAAVKGMPTMTLKRSVGSGLSNIWLMTVTFYDRRGHVIQSQTNNQLNYTTEEQTTDTKTVVPDFVGRPQQALTVKSTGTTNKVLTTFNYDNHMARLISVSQQYNSQAAVTIAAYAYNELGQLITKNLGNTSGSNYLQTLSYAYNIRGQLLGINSSQLTGTYSSSVFGMQFLYDSQDAGVLNTPYYSGRLSAVKWMTKDGNGNNSNERSYAYTYDNLDRLTASSYAERIGSTGGFGTNVSAYDESGITYDENGNIQTLNRNSVVSGSIAQVDKLQYTYAASNPDSLINMADGLTANYTSVGFRNLTGSTANYAYDLNGNLTTDPYKGLTLAYDVLNKTDKITVNTSTNRWIDYTYDGSGSVIRKRVYDNNMLQTTTDYIDGFVYTNSTLAYFPMPEGRVVNNAGTLTPEYIITDMQGNARISFNNTGTGGTAKVVQENSYSGFGLVLANSAVSGGSNKNLYNGGSEWQNDYSNLPDYYQTFYRNYDAEIGRFISTDPEPESSESMTPYQYAGNDPVMMNDPMGNKQLPKETPPAPTPEQVVFANNGYYTGPTYASQYSFGDENSDILWAEQQADPGYVAQQNAINAGGKVIYQAANGSTPATGLTDDQLSGLTYSLNQGRGAALVNGGIYYASIEVTGFSHKTDEIDGTGTITWNFVDLGASQGGYQTFNETFYSQIGTLSTSSYDADDKRPGNSASQISSTGYYFKAEVSLKMTSPNNYTLIARLFYVGGHMDDMTFNSGISSLIDGTYYNRQQFTSDDGSSYISPPNYTYLGSAGYDFKGNFGSFNLIIHAGVGISEFWGNTAGSTSLNLSIPIISK